VKEADNDSAARASFGKSLVRQALHLRIRISDKYAQHICPSEYCCPIKSLLPKALENQLFFFMSLSSDRAI
jgi:hypothetical protein